MPGNLTVSQTLMAVRVTRLYMAKFWGRQAESLEMISMA